MLPVRGKKETTRRQMIWGAAAAAGSIASPDFLFKGGAAQSTAGRLRGGQVLPTPDFQTLRRTAQFYARVRPHRIGGVHLALEPEIMTAGGPKSLIHNYGHSGAGITLSWGCAGIVRDYVETVINQMRGTSTRPSIAVLGCGVIGLTVATELRRKWPNLPIVVYSKTMDFNQITSFIAGGQFEPSQIWHEYNTSGTQPVLDDYLRRSAQRIRELRGKWGEYGIVVRPNYALDDTYPSFDEHTPHDVVAPFVSGRLPFARLNVVGREYQTWLLNPRIMLPRLKADLMRSSVRFTAKEFTDRGEVERLPENIVVNCTGYGAKQLFNDDALKPRRGHIALLRNPAYLKYLFSGGCSNHVISYLFARQNDIIVGGTVLLDDDRDYFDTNDPADGVVCNRIMDNIVKVFDDRSDSCIDPVGMV